MDEDELAIVVIIPKCIIHSSQICSPTHKWETFQVALVNRKTSPCFSPLHPPPTSTHTCLPPHLSRCPLTPPLSGGHQSCDVGEDMGVTHNLAHTQCTTKQLELYRTHTPSHIVSASTSVLHRNESCSSSVHTCM